MKPVILKAIGDSTRLILLKRIEKSEVCACTLPKTVGTSQPAVSQHLKVLLGAGLVRMRKDGARRLYSISAKGRQVLGDIRRW